MNFLEEGVITLKHEISPLQALYLAGGIFVAIVLGVALGSALVKR